MPQQATMGPAPIEGVERTNVVVVRGSEPGAGQSVGIPPRQDPFAMEINRGRNYYACGCYESMLQGLSKELTLVLSDTRELNRVPSTK